MELNTIAAENNIRRRISRLDYGAKYCKDSVTIDESGLHEAIIQAINATRCSRHEMIPYLTAQLT